MLVAIAAGAIIGLLFGILRTVEQTIKLLTIVLSVYEFPWDNSLAVLEVLILVCTSALTRRYVSTCHSDTPIMGSGHVRLYPLDTVPTDIIVPYVIRIKVKKEHFNLKAITMIDPVTGCFKIKQYYDKKLYQSRT